MSAKRTIKALVKWNRKLLDELNYTKQLNRNQQYDLKHVRRMEEVLLIKLESAKKEIRRLHQEELAALEAGTRPLAPVQQVLEQQTAMLNLPSEVIKDPIKELIMKKTKIKQLQLDLNEAETSLRESQRENEIMFRCFLVAAGCSVALAAYVIHGWLPL